jgi:phosphoribosyl-AMP cyclohydrolase
MMTQTDWLDRIKWDQNGLIPVIAQEQGSNQILMVAWMNRESLTRTVACGQAVYWSRSRNKLWHKGEESGHFQKVHQIRLDCDDDVLLLQVEQVGGMACHTGRHSCFFHELQSNDGAMGWVEVEPVLKNPDDIYKK